MPSPRRSKPFTSVGGSIQPHPLYGGLDAAGLASLLGALMRAAGGTVGSVVALHEPLPAQPPNVTLAPWRFWQYNRRVAQTVATCLRKELHAYTLLRRHEARTRARFDWVLLLREDSHWFAPLDLRAFGRGVTHGKACATWGGWNDHVFLIWRTHVRAMLTSYRALHTPPSELPVRHRCWRHPVPAAGASHPAAAPLPPGAAKRAWRISLPTRDLWKHGLAAATAHGVTGKRVAWRRVAPFGGAGLAVDALACKTMEGWRARVGDVWRIRYQPHPPSELPTTDARLVLATTAARSLDAWHLQRAHFPTVVAALGEGAAPRAHAHAAAANASEPGLRREAATPRGASTTTTTVGCFPGAYAFGSSTPEGQKLLFQRHRSCVPRGVVHAVWEMSCEQMVQPADGPDGSGHGSGQAADPATSSVGVGMGVGAGPVAAAGAGVALLLAWWSMCTKRAHAVTLLLAGVALLLAWWSMCAKRAHGQAR